MSDSYHLIFSSSTKSDSKTTNYKDFFTSLSDEQINKINQNYKVITVDWLDKVLVDSEMFGDGYFNKNLEKKKVVDDMLDFYLGHKDKPIYKKTDYLCNEKEKICICNTHAEDFRKIYDRNNYKPGEKYISWIRKSNEHF